MDIELRVTQTLSIGFEYALPPKRKTWITVGQTKVGNITVGAGLDRRKESKMRAATAEEDRTRLKQ